MSCRLKLWLDRGIDHTKFHRMQMLHVLYTKKQKRTTHCVICSPLPAIRIIMILSNIFEVIRGVCIKDLLLVIFGHTHSNVA